MFITNPPRSGNKSMLGYFCNLFTIVPNEKKIDHTAEFPKSWVLLQNLRHFLKNVALKIYDTPHTNVSKSECKFV